MILFSEDIKRGISFTMICIDEFLFEKDSYLMLKLVFVQKGSCIMFINNSKVIISSPSVICLNYKDDYFVQSQSSDFKSFAIYFTPDILNSLITFENIEDGATKESYITFSQHQDSWYLLPFIQNRINLKFIFRLSPEIFARYQKLYNNLKSEITEFRSDFWRCRSRSYLIEILSLIQYLYTENVDNNIKGKIDDLAIISDILIYIHTNYNKKITLQTLTKEFQINRTTLNNHFKKETTMSVLEYIISHRIKTAELLLRDTLLPVSEIAYRVGFNDLTHFGKTFKKIMGISASNYRKNIQL